MNQLGYFAAQGSDNKSLARYLGMTAEDMWEDFMPQAPAEVKHKASQELVIIKMKEIN